MKNIINYVEYNYYKKIISKSIKYILKVHKIQF